MVDTGVFVSTLSSNQFHTLLFFYTDPGAGALLWQLLVASLVGGAFYARLLIRQLKARVNGQKKGASAYPASLGDPSRSQLIK
jgi:hypothetical protein